MRITVLAGGIGGARFTRGLLHHLAAPTGGSGSSGGSGSGSGGAASDD